MSAFLYAILTLLALGTGFIAVSKVSERRSSKSKASQDKTAAEVTSPATVKSESQTVAEAPPRRQPVLPTQPAKTTVQPSIPDPWDAEVSQPEAVSQPEVSPAVTETPVAATVSPAASVPDRVTSEALVAAIAQAGRSGQLQQMAYVKRYVNHADSQVRVAVATALGQLASGRQGAAVADLIPLLGHLCQDSNFAVRRAAVEALGHIQSPKVLPLLQQAQKQPDRGISQAAARSLQKLKLTYQPKPARVAPKPAKPTRK